MGRRNTTKLIGKIGRQAKEQSDNQTRKNCEKELRLEGKIMTQTQSAVHRFGRLAAENWIRLLRF